jgi:hypothetical protein
VSLRRSFGYNGPRAAVNKNRHTTDDAAKAQNDSPYECTIIVIEIS